MRVLVCLLLLGSWLNPEVAAKICDLESGIKTATKLASGQVPHVGTVLKELIEFVWPDNCNPRENVRQVVQHAIDRSKEDWLKDEFRGIKWSLENMKTR